MKRALSYIFQVVPVNRKFKLKLFNKDDNLKFEINIFLFFVYKNYVNLLLFDEFIS